MFQIMTEAQLKEADEQALRERVRELMSATSALREISSALREMVGMQRSSLHALAQIMSTLRQVEMNQRQRHLPKPPRVTKLRREGPRPRREKR
jgi:hypothetical protein